MTTLTLQERVAETLEDFKAQGWRDPWDTTVVEQKVAPSTRGAGLAVFTLIADGFTFESPVLPGDDLVEFFGVQALH
jgi:hypothetical protein